MDLVSAANLIPGPNSTELVIHIGLQRAGYAGMLVAVVAHALLGLGRAALRRWQALLIVGGVLLLALAGVNEVGLLLAGAAAGWWLFGSPQVRMPPAAALLLLLPAAAMCCRCFCGRTWWCGWAGSRSASCWMPWLPAS